MRKFCENFCDPFPSATLTHDRSFLMHAQLVFLVNADHSGVYDIFSEGRNKRGIALLSCPICPRIRSESLHDLAKKNIYYNRSGVYRLVTLSTLFLSKKHVA